MQKPASRLTPKRNKPKARAYLFRLGHSQGWRLFIGPVRNLAEAQLAIEASIGEKPTVVRAHRMFDPWQKTLAATGVTT